MNTAISSLDTLIEWHRQWQDIVQTQRMRGLNDFNLLTTVLSPHDETRLHSRFIGAMLDPHGAHGQGRLFLDLFLGRAELDDLIDDSEPVAVHLEYERIDIYIESATTRILIENKIHAGDQKRQLQRYLDILLRQESRQNDEAGGKRILAIYLTPDGRNPSDESLGRFRLTEHDGEHFLDDGRHRILFRALSYRQHIRHWIADCQTQIGNLTNLNLAFEQYEEVVRQITGSWRSRTMTLNRWYEETSEDRKPEILKQWKTLHDEYTGFRYTLIRDGILRPLQQRLQKWISDKPGWILEMDPEAMAMTKPSNPLHIRPENGRIGITLEFEGNHYHLPYYGIRRISESTDLDVILRPKNEATKELDELRKKVLAGFRPSPPWWIGWTGYGNKKDLVELIVEKGGEQAVADDLFQTLATFFDQTRDYVLKADRILGQAGS